MVCIAFTSLLFFFVHCMFVISQSTPYCYWPNGSLDTARIPCSDTSNGTQSACCYSTDICSRSGYCLNDKGFVYRASCTDQTWKSTSCPTRCTSSEGKLAPKQSFTSMSSVCQVLTPDLISSHQVLLKVFKTFSLKRAEKLISSTSFIIFSPFETILK